MRTAHRSRPVVTMAVNYLRKLIDSQGLKQGSPLPPIRPLAKLAGVSHVTICKALGDLRSAGVVEKGPSGSYHVGRVSRSPLLTDEAPLPNNEAFMRPWRRIADSVTRDIRNGIFRSGTLVPAIKDLERRYRVSDKTITKALRYLADEKTLERLSNGKMAVPRLTSDVWKSCISCVLMASDQYKVDFGQNDEDLFRTLESLCEHAGITMNNLLTFYNKRQDAYFFREARTGKVHEKRDLETIADASILGFIYYLTWQPDEEDVNAIGYLLKNKKPVAILDETASLKLSPQIANSRYLRIFNVAASAQPGMFVARRLLSLNHQRIAFFSADHQYAWSKLREEGLRSHYDRSGLGDGVVPFVVETPTVYEDSSRRGDLSALASIQRPWLDALPEPYRIEFDAAMERIRWESWRHAELRLRLQPMFESALNDRSITAWVAVNDVTAAMALDFLRNHGLQVPADLSVISFDDSHRALAANITSYNFNIYAIGTSMLGFILGKRPYADEAGVQGYIVDRRSTGPARKR